MSVGYMGISVNPTGICEDMSPETPERKMHHPALNAPSDLAVRQLFLSKSFK